ncbi:hypothetical protein WN51_00346 [Melipona quadrifasciata]|uniref:Uncharacterized protein n=1 Tax=Melipona quadrifasciata TaxID=166423 RepID=A0A0M8ZXP6_9HYME|nr:hypothetical protein WN51_00346 [Melipona quadrifasciata]
MDQQSNNFSSKGPRTDIEIKSRNQNKLIQKQRKKKQGNITFAKSSSLTIVRPQQAGFRRKSSPTISSTESQTGTKAAPNAKTPPTEFRNFSPRGQEWETKRGEWQRTCWFHQRSSQIGEQREESVGGGWMGTAKEGHADSQQIEASPSGTKKEEEGGGLGEKEKRFFASAENRLRRFVVKKLGEVLMSEATLVGCENKRKRAQARRSLPCDKLFLPLVTCIIDVFTLVGCLCPLYSPNSMLFSAINLEETTEKVTYKLEPKLSPKLAKLIHSKKSRSSKDVVEMKIFVEDEGRCAFLRKCTEIQEILANLAKFQKVEPTNNRRKVLISQCTLGEPTFKLPKLLPVVNEPTFVLSPKEPTKFNEERKRRRIGKREKERRKAARDFLRLRKDGRDKRFYCADNTEKLPYDRESRHDPTDQNYLRVFGRKSMKVNNDLAGGGFGDKEPGYSPVGNAKSFGEWGQSPCKSISRVFERLARYWSSENEASDKGFTVYVVNVPDYAHSRPWPLYGADADEIQAQRRRRSSKGLKLICIE